MKPPTKSERERASDELVRLIQKYLLYTYTREDLNNGGVNLPKDANETPAEKMRAEDTLDDIRREVKKGDSTASLILGLMYTSGAGRYKQDWCCAYKWLTLAVNQGYEHKEDAQNALTNLKIVMPPEERNRAERMEKK